MNFLLDVAPDPPAAVGLGAALLLVILVFGAVVAVLLVFLLRARRKRLDLREADNHIADQIESPVQPSNPNQ